MAELDQTQDWRLPDFPWPAPAKLNLFLHITGRRDDGYHLLQSVFQFIDFHDDIYFEITPDGRISRENELTGVEEHDDLVIRAAKSLQAATNCAKGCRIRVEKRLPMGGGLGGGSSDAATTLLALNHLWDCGCSLHQLAELGVALGADVPIFVHGQAAWAESVGEQLTSVTLEEPWFVVIIPDVHVDTGQIFSSPELTRDQHPIKIRDFLDGDTVNICQPLVEQMYPPIKQAIEWLAQYGPARMTGTGACVFAPFSDRHSAEACLSEIPTGWQAVLAKGLNKTPIYKMFEDNQN